MSEQQPATTPGPEARAFNRRVPRPVGKIALALAKAQVDFEEIKRDCSVDFGQGTKHVKFNYASLASIYAATRKALSKNELALCHYIDGEELVCQLLHSSGEFMVSVVHIGSPRQWKEFGGNITYATRYAVGGLLGCAAEDDMDAPEGERQQRSQQRPAERQQRGKGADARQASGQATSSQQGGEGQRQQTQEEKAVETARKSAEKCDTPGKLTALARRYKNRSLPEKKAIGAVGKAKGWKWNKEESVFEEPPPADGPPEDDSFMPVDQDGNEAL